MRPAITIAQSKSRHTIPAYQALLAFWGRISLEVMLWPLASVAILAWQRYGHEVDTPLGLPWFRVSGLRSGGCEAMLMGRGECLLGWPEGGMVREFTITGMCVPGEHYMVDVSDRVVQMRLMVERGKYYCVNRPRQYGKTTTLAALETALCDDYSVASLDFQGLSQVGYTIEAAFVRVFCRRVLRTCREIPASVAKQMRVLAFDRGTEWVLDDLFDVISDWCSQSKKPVVLIIDEVDGVTNNQAFLDFLALLRQHYLQRQRYRSWPTFQSVVLAGVTDVRHLKAKIRPDDQISPNSPWNIAADFDVNMSFSEADVQGMLGEYEADHATGMDVVSVADEIIEWTGGYPFLVSCVCQIMDVRDLTWEREGVRRAVVLLLQDDDVSLFGSLTGQLERHPDLKERLRGVLMRGEEIDYSPYDEMQKKLRMYGFAKRQNGKLVVANRVFETLLCDYLLAEEKSGPMRSAAMLSRNRFVVDGRLEMRAVLEGFRRTWHEIFGPLRDGPRFDEFDGRKQFLLYLKPIINGTGNYYIEAQTRDQTRTDVIVDYAGIQYVVELKIWRGPRYNEESEEQLRGYLDHFGLSVGYMLSFNFNKKKEPGLKRVNVDGRVLWEETI